MQAGCFFFKLHFFDVDVIFVTIEQHGSHTRRRSPLSKYKDKWACTVMTHNNNNKINCFLCESKMCEDFARKK